MTDYVRYDASQISAWMTAVFEKLGVPSRDAAITTDTLVDSDLMGIDSHGLARVAVHPSYARGLREGTVDPNAVPEVVYEAAATAVVDGHGGLGPVAATRAMELAIDKARETGAGFVSVTNSRHYGAAAHYSRMALEHGMIGISMTIGGLGVVPTFGRGRRIGINPMSVAAPAENEPPFILDIATSVVAAGKLELAKMAGKQVPLGWIVDAEGKPTTDPDDFWRGGALLPLGGAPETGSYKGYGLSVMIDIFCGILSGLGFSAGLKTAGQDATPHFQGALRVDGFRPLGGFKAMMDDLLQTLKATEPAEGAERVLVHGEKEARARLDRERNGIPYHRQVVGTLEQLAGDVGIPLPAPVPG
ncbi:MAG: Ldh family oxidoreductase [Chloroflexi bacterium]|nr:Ldh family oxidoreductase [Chloroflexota bacterium]